MQIPPHQHCPGCGYPLPLSGAPPQGEQWECVCSEIVFGWRGDAAWIWSVAGSPAHCLNCHDELPAARKPKPVRIVPKPATNGRGGIAV